MPFNSLISSTDHKTILFPAGHTCLAVGGKSQKELWSSVDEWLTQRSKSTATPKV